MKEKYPKHGIFEPIYRKHGLKSKLKKLTKG